MCACPSQEVVERYLNGGCSGDECQGLEEHLTSCEDCRDRVESTRSNMAGTVNSRPDSEQTQILQQDERPTESVSEATVVPHTAGGLPKSLESMIAGYKIVEALPRGGQAVVYKAVHTATKTNVAIKVLLPTLLASERARYYFEREAELIAGLDHPNIISIRDSGIIHGQYYFVMQYIEGEPLRKYVHTNQLDFRQRVQLVGKVCSAITYAHQQGVIHRDLKFANILVDKRGEPHILDFGLAKAIGIDEQAGENVVATMTGQWAGSLTTMSPEQASGHPNLIDVRTDVYSLGVILYSLLTGRYPYDVSGTTLKALRNIQEAEPVRPRQIDRKFDSEMEAILLTALAKEREKRYQSAADFKADIDNWLKGLPIRVKSISSMYLLRKVISRHRYTSTVVALVVLIVLGFAWISFELFMSSERALDKAEGYARDSAAMAAEVPTLRRRLTFGCFLQAWNAGDQRYAQSIADRITGNTKENRAAAFLLDPRPLEEKLDGFRQALKNENTGFADFVIGEYYRKNGDRDQAVATYRSGYQALRKLDDCALPADTWLNTCLRARLLELKAPEDSNQENAGIQNGGQEK